MYIYIFCMSIYSVYKTILTQDARFLIEAAILVEPPRLGIYSIDGSLEKNLFSNFKNSILGF